MRYILDFQDHLSQANIDSYTGNIPGMVLLRKFHGFGNIFVAECAVAPTPDDILQSAVLDEDGGIKLLGLDLILSPGPSKEVSFDINDDKNWWKVAALNTVDFDVSNYTHTSRGESSTVYILDSGIELTHPEFVDADISLLHSYTGEFVDRRGHGTAIASLISGKTCGLTQAKLKIIKIFEKGVPTYQSDLLGALDAVLVDYIANGKKPSVVNLSWGIAKNIYLNSKIEQMIAQGLYVIAAAGNSGMPIGDVTPASIPSVLTVGSFGQDLAPSDFSNYTGGSGIAYTDDITNTGALDGWAPGEMIWTASLAGGYNYSAGTSMSAAIAAGSLAYNFAKYVDDNGDAPAEFTNYVDNVIFLQKIQKYTRLGESSYTPTPFWHSAISKPDLLDLSDPKYSNSVNKIVTYDARPNNLLPTQRIAAIGGETTYKILVSRYTVERVVTTQDIPNFITIDNRGLVKVVAPDITTILERLAPIDFTLYLRDGSVISLTLNVFLTQAGIDKDNIEEFVPAGDPLIDTFKFYACSSGSGCSPDCFHAGCPGYPAGKFFVCYCA